MSSLWVLDGNKTWWIRLLTVLAVTAVTRLAHRATMHITPTTFQLDCPDGRRVVMTGLYGTEDDMQVIGKHVAAVSQAAARRLGDVQDVPDELRAITREKTRI